MDTKNTQKLPFEIRLIPRVEFHGEENVYMAVCEDGFRLAFDTADEARRFIIKEGCDDEEYRSSNNDTSR